MRWHGWAVTALAVGLGAAGAPAVRAAIPQDACALLSSVGISAVLGVPVGAGSHMRPEYLGTCTWGQAGGTLLSGRSVVIGLKTGPAFDIGKGLAAARRRPLRGIGDEAYYAGAGQGGRRPILNVKKGGMAFNIAVYGDVPPERAKAMERALAKQILGRL